MVLAEKKNPKCWHRVYTELPILSLVSYFQYMPKSNSIIPAPLREGLFETFRATTRLVRPERRRQIILVGGTASIAHYSRLRTEDVDVAAPPSVLIGIWGSDGRRP